MDRLAEASVSRVRRGVITLAHRDLGGDGHPPLVILHGMLGSSRNWQTAGRDLAHHFHVLAPDLRNHGGSPHSDRMDYEAMMDDVIGWMRSGDLERATFVGHSMGGKVAMLLACRHPALVERLVVADIAPKDYHWVGHRAEFAAMNELDLRHLKSRAEAELRFEARIDDWAVRKFIATNLERTEDGGWRWLINLPVLTAALPVLEKTPLAPTDRFEGPAKFIVGGRSTYVSPDDTGTIRRHFPHAEIETIPAAGHNPHMQTRTEFVKAISGR